MESIEILSLNRSSDDSRTLYRKCDLCYRYNWACALIYGSISRRVYLITVSTYIFLYYADTEVASRKFFRNVRQTSISTQTWKAWRMLLYSPHKCDKYSRFKTYLDSTSIFISAPSRYLLWYHNKHENWNPG